MAKKSGRARKLRAATNFKNQLDSFKRNYMKEVLLDGSHVYYPMCFGQVYKEEAFLTATAAIQASEEIQKEMAESLKQEAEKKESDAVTLDIQDGVIGTE